MKAVKPFSLALSLSITMTSLVPAAGQAAGANVDVTTEAISAAIRARAVSDQAKVEIERHEGHLRLIGGEERAYRFQLERYQIIQREQFIRNTPLMVQQALRAVDGASLSGSTFLNPLAEPNQPFTFRTKGLKTSDVTTDGKVDGRGLLKDNPSVPVKVSLVDADLAKSGDWRYDTDSFLTPATKVDEISLLKHPLDALSRRIFLLTGRQYSRAEIHSLSSGNLKLDWSKLPKYDRIYISSLEITKDNLGKGLIESLKQHARNGTDVRILVSQAFYDGVEQETPGEGLASIAYLQKAMEETKNFPGKITVQLYKYDEPDYGGNTAISTADFHRVQHAKMMLLINDRDPQQTRAILGGRNLSNNYFFMKSNEFKPSTSMVHFDEDSYASYADLEVELKSAALISDIAAQFSAMWNRDLTKYRDQKFQAPFQHLPVAGLGSAGLGDSKVVRHFYSLPFVNGGEDRGIEPLFVKLINSAQKSIKITTPYFHPTRAIVAALQNALNKPGMSVTIVTNIDFTKDGLLPQTVRAANRAGIISIGDKAEFRLWKTDEASTMIHAKTMAIDDHTLYVGSANMNHRSFVHDAENGLLIRDRAIVADYKKNYEEFFVKHSQKTTAAEVAKKYDSSVLLRLIKDVF